MSGEQATGGQGDEPVPGGARRGVHEPGAARVDALDALLRDIDGLRRTLETDLTLVAGALDAGAPDLAVSLLDSDRADVARFEARAFARLRQLALADAAEDAAAVVPPAVVPAAPVEPVAVEPVVVALAPRRRSRLVRLLPAAPLVAAAAALVGLLGVVPSAPTRPAPADSSGAVLSSWAELERLAAADAPADQVQRAAMDLNAEIASMVAKADGDPEAARRALALLREAQVVLAADDDALALQQVLQQSRALAARLLASLPPVVRSSPRLPQVPAVEAPAVVPLPRPTAPSRATSPRPARRWTTSTTGSAAATPSPTADSRPTSAPASAQPTPTTTSPAPARPTLLPDAVTARFEPR